MSQPEMILDYASPRKRSAMRMAARSVLEYAPDGEGGVVVRERLADQVQALAAIAMSGLCVSLVWPAALSGPVRFSAGVLVLPALMTAAWLVVSLMVVQRSWGRTELRVADGMVRLYMGGPLGHRRYAWRFEQVHAVRVVALGGQWDAWPLGEIEILAEGSVIVRLFTDHLESRLREVAGAVDRVLKGEGENPNDETRMTNQ